MVSILDQLRPDVDATVESLAAKEFATDPIAGRKYSLIPTVIGSAQKRHGTLIEKAILAAVDGICAGAGAIIAMASDLRFASADAKVAFLFTRVGLAGCDMGACAMLPRIIGQGRAAELLFMGRSMNATEGSNWGFFNGVSDAPLEAATQAARRLLQGPSFAHGMTKTMLNQEWNMSIDQAIEAEAQTQAICMQTEDFKRAYNAFVNKEKPVFQGD